mmetsp:Transcript_24599/g.52018  ORF Transcript_24599/g.52018 Transcript_24599/m.52018 type:complete len:207 (-) Transcript_24599:1547-2167(-)
MHTQSFSSIFPSPYHFYHSVVQYCIIESMNRINQSFTRGGSVGRSRKSRAPAPPPRCNIRGTPTPGARLLPAATARASDQRFPTGASVAVEFVVVVDAPHQCRCRCRCRSVAAATAAMRARVAGVVRCRVCVAVPVRCRVCGCHHRHPLAASASAPRGSPSSWIWWGRSAIDACRHPGGPVGQERRQRSRRLPGSCPEPDSTDSRE